MILNQSIIKAINHCLNNGTAFAAYRLPGEAIVFFADDGGAPVSSRYFIVNSWNTPASQNIIIRDCIDSDAVFSINGKSTDKVLPESTSEDEYIKQVSWLIEHLKLRGGKTVVSRTLAGKSNDINWAKKAAQLFESFPNAFCHIYYTPQTGAWMGATPEVLLNVDTNGEFTTMALAGTHPVGQQWDTKNRNEQQMVTDFISDVLTPRCSKLLVHSAETLQYGKIEHLCSRFEGQLNQDISPLEVLDILSPTPAVSGLPREDALTEINHIEAHQRECYSGYIAICNDLGLKAYVNLRCMQFTTQGSFCLYAGGGVTAESNPHNEWEETNIKLASLLSIINS